MNNEAFRKLVREQVTTTTSTTSSNSTTREFARQAVQAEFRQKRKRRHKGKDDGDYSTDEDNDNNDDDNARFSKKGKQHPFELQPTQVRRKKGESTMGPTQNEAKYRDRAKERREGKLPEEGNELLLLSSRSEEEDDENDQLLDAVLEAAEKGQIVQGPTDDDGTRDEDDGGNKPRLPNTEMEAREWILAASSSSSSSLMQLMPKTALGREMLSFLRSRYLQDQQQQQQQQQQTISSVTPAAGRAIQRSTLTFSLRAFPGDTRHAWEVPSERTYATEHPMLSSTTTCEKASPATKELLEKLLRNNSCLQRKLAAKEREKWRVVEKPGKDSLKPQAKKAGNGQATTATASNDSDDDDDEDIFGGAGDYDFTEEAAVAGEDDKEQKESGNKEPVPRVRFSDSEHKDAQWSVVGWTQQGQDSSDADRMALPRLSKVSGYDEEVDMDFDGRLEEEDSDDDDDDEEQQRKKAKRKKKGSAEADEDD